MEKNQYSLGKEFWDKSKSRIRSDVLVNPSIIKAVGNVRDKKILDICCGDGSLTEYFANRGAAITGIDINNDVIGFTKSRKGRYLRGDATNLKLQRNSFDKAYSSMVFLHMDDNQLEKAFLEVWKVLKKNGEFIVGDVHPTRLIQNKEPKLVKHKNKNIDYFLTQKISATLFDFNKKSIDLEYYHRSLSTYINTALKTGFILKSVIEPKPTKEQLKEFGEFLKVETTQPSYIIFVFRKV